MTKALRALVLRVAGSLRALRSADADRATREEMQQHLEMETAENVRRGLPQEEARRRALIASGGITSAGDAVRDRRGLPWIDELVGDARYALRALRRAPAFTVVAVLTLALGVGANSAIFSVVNGVVLKPLRYGDPERLVSVLSFRDGSAMAVSPADFMDWRRQARSFTGLAAAYTSQTILTGGGEPERLSQARVSANTFDLLAVEPVLGRAFVPGEDEPAAPRVAMLGEGLWRRRFGGDASVVGRSIVLDGFPTLVVGVAPATAAWPEAVDLWLTTDFSPRDLSDAARGARWLTVLGRVGEGASLEAARGELEVIARRLAELDPKHNSNVGVLVRPLLASMVGDVRTPLLILLAAVGCVLLIACANVASLTLARVAARDAEIAVRTALGAGRARIARQILTESLLLSLAGGAVGLLFAVWGMKGLVALAPRGLPRLQEVTLDGSVLAFTFATAVLTGLVFGVAAAVAGPSANLHDRLQAAGRGSRGRRGGTRARRTLVVVEVSAAIVLLAGAGLLLRSFAKLRDVDPGFRAPGVTTFNVALPSTRYGNEEQQRQFTDALLDGIRRVPGVTTAAMSFSLPLSGSGFGFTFEVSGRPPADPANEPRAQARVATPGYFAAMGIPLVRGRLFDERDRAASRQVVVISSDLARRYFPGEEPIGRYLETGWSADDRKFGGEVIGVVGDVRQVALDGGKTAHMYMPYDQWPLSEYDVVVRADSPTSVVIDGARAVLRRLDAEVPMNGPVPLTALVDSSLGERRFYLLLLGAFAAVAMALAAVGLYGVIAYGVQQRRREIGIRLALGASRHRVLGMVVTDGMRLVLAGAVIGVVAASVATRVLGALLFEVGARDPMTFVAAPLLLTIAAVLACVVPARRAARMNPLETIRADCGVANRLRSVSSPSRSAACTSRSAIAAGGAATRRSRRPARRR